MTTDKHGAQLDPGDSVLLVYNGEHALMVITEVEPPVPNGPTPHVTGTIQVRVPAPSCELFRKAEPPPVHQKPAPHRQAAK